MSPPLGMKEHKIIKLRDTACSLEAYNKIEEIRMYNEISHEQN